MPHFCLPAPPLAPPAPPTFLGGGGAFPFTRAFAAGGVVVVMMVIGRRVETAPTIDVWRKERRSAFKVVVVWSVLHCRLVVWILLLLLFVNENAVTVEEEEYR